MLPRQLGNDKRCYLKRFKQYRIENLSNKEGAETRRGISRMTGRGFTLIELLMVIAVISILLTLLAPNFSRIFARARQTKCLANLRKQGQGMLAYVEEYGHFPGATASSSGGAVAGWVTLMRAYSGGSYDHFICPSMRDRAYHLRKVYGSGSGFARENDARDMGLYYEPGERLLRIHGTHLSYGYNDWGTMGAFELPGTVDRCLGMGGDPGWRRPRLSEVVRPDQQIVVADRAHSGEWDNVLDPYNAWEVPYPSHMGGTNILMADGRAEWIEWNKLVHVNRHMSDSHEIRRRWNRDFQSHHEHASRWATAVCLCVNCTPDGWWHRTHPDYASR